ncbi:MAG TPA: hypothetical protein VEK15_02260 [Vicinamibacteria bacterium]|nr:hypothetical protein [Vicinamibacteria bacterium]
MLDAILAKIDRVYGLDLGVEIADFLIGKEMCTRLGVEARNGSVIVKDGQGAVELGVYIGEEQLKCLESIDLTAELSPVVLEHLLVGIEEVSHFAYLVFSTSRRRPVTQLELELQAEVDKYVTSILLLAANNGGRVPSNLMDRLFSDFRPREDLDSEQRERYWAASSLASRYCSYVVQASLETQEFGRLLPELRSFYRLNQQGKIGHIHNIVYTA